ncbi:MAG: hypothetical protein M1819_003364 [Sarea resinae]|nr:MAG: hypothetical protein M1819_003364 [Sarea resinae]
MTSRIQQDSFIDDSDDACPLCVEEFDLSDRNFRPCPCGYQVCQFCFNNIKNNMNGLCPACRRPYDEKTIEWKVVSPEEFKADLQQQARKKAAARQKEAQKREVESQNRKHLAGLRVVQKNLVYVVGLNPRIREEDLLQTLRGEQYFGQYGKIVKIVVSKAKDGSHPNQSMGVYVTFARKEDAASCIAAVDGSQNGDRVLRAQYGTTKYCSAYLRNEPCNNRNCMFLHEPGEENDSFTRQDLSSMNVVSTQRPAQNAASSAAAAGHRQAPSQPTPQPQPPPQQAPQTVAAAAPAMGRQASRDGAASPADSGDGSALPSTASWASKGLHQQSRRTSRAASGATPSPKTTNATTASNAVEDQKTDHEKAASDSEPTRPSSEEPASPDPHSTATKGKSTTAKQNSIPLLDNLIKSVNSPAFIFSFNYSMFSPEELEMINSYPPLFADNGGAKRRAMREREEEERRKLEEETQIALQAISAADPEENASSGSLQLGGEPEARSDSGDQSTQVLQEQPRQAIRPPSQQMRHSPAPRFNQSYNLSNNLSNLTINGRGLTPLQQQQLLLLKSGNGQPSNFLDQFPPGMQNGMNLNQANHLQSGLFQNQNQQLAGAPGHARQSSRYTFANDSASASAAVKPAANAKLMAQQSAMMPSGNSHNLNTQGLGHQQLSSQFFGSGVQGPPPGLKSAGTPPVSGGGMFGQGHGFTGAMGGMFGANNLNQKDNNAELMRELLRGRGGASGAVNGQLSDAGKREYMFPTFLHQYPSTSSTPVSAQGPLSSLYGPQLGAYQDSGPQKQKKKGKKHRHANTSSSGGGGIVDLADPSILQARMHQGGASGAGQGLFGGQGQEEETSPALDEASIDALVNEAPSDYRPFSASGFFSGSGRSTPLYAPPGLPFPQGQHPPLSILSEESPRKHSPAKSTTSSVITPAIPIIPITPGRISTPLKREVKDVDIHEPVSTPPNHGEEKESKLEAKAHVSKPAESDPFLDAPAKLTGEKAVGGMLKSEKQPASTKDASDAPKPSTSEHKVGKNGRATEEASKRQAPGKLDISAATQAASKELQAATAAASSASAKVETPTKGTKAANVPTSRPSTPGSTTTRGAESPAVRQTQARTLRVLPTPKTETPPPSATFSAVASSVQAALAKQPSRQSSIASMNRPGTPSMNRPGTPASELISETASFTSTSLSRANSPPPSKVGSAPVRVKTKSQQKKQRQERAKLAEQSVKVEEALQLARAEETVQAPIISRKKKTKKQGGSATGGSTPAVSRPVSPTPKEKEKVDKSSDKTAKERSKSRDSDKAESNQASITPEVSTKAITPASIISDLQSAGELDPSSLEIFKSILGLNHRHDISAADFQELERKLNLTDDERTALSAGHPIRRLGSPSKPSSRVLISPSGAILRGLTPEQEAHFLTLEKRTTSARGPTKYTPKKAGSEFTLIGGRVVQTPTDVSLIAHHSGLSSQHRPLPDPASKMRVDEALDYINQFVLPALPACGRLENSPSVQGVADFGLRVAEDIARGGQGPDPLGCFAPPPPHHAATSLSSRHNHSSTAATTTTSASNTSSHAHSLPTVPLLGVEEAEKAMLAARKETEALEKRLNGLLKRNRRFAFGSSGH